MGTFLQMNDVITTHQFDNRRAAIGNDDVISPAHSDSIITPHGGVLVVVVIAQEVIILGRADKRLNICIRIALWKITFGSA